MALGITKKSLRVFDQLCDLSLLALGRAELNAASVGRCRARRIQILDRLTESREQLRHRTVAKRANGIPLVAVQESYLAGEWLDQFAQAGHLVVQGVELRRLPFP